MVVLRRLEVRLPHGSPCGLGHGRFRSRWGLWELQVGVAWQSIYFLLLIISSFTFVFQMCNAVVFSEDTMIRLYYIHQPTARRFLSSRLGGGGTLRGTQPLFRLPGSSVVSSPSFMTCLALDLKFEQCPFCPGLNI